VADAQCKGENASDSRLSAAQWWNSTRRQSSMAPPIS
jgi:hypothetical protein